MKISEKAIKELIKLRSEKIKDPTKTLKIVTFPLWQGEGDFGIVIQERFDTDIIVKDNNNNEIITLKNEYETENEKLKRENISYKRQLEQQMKLKNIIENELKEINIKYIKLEENLINNKLPTQELY